MSERFDRTKCIVVTGASKGIGGAAAEALAGLPFRASYAAAKSALESLTSTMAVELAGDGMIAAAIAFFANEDASFTSQAKYFLSMEAQVSERFNDTL